MANRVVATVVRLSGVKAASHSHTPMSSQTKMSLSTVVWALRGILKGREMLRCKRLQEVPCTLR